MSVAEYQFYGDLIEQVRLAPQALAGATISIVNNDGAGEGFDILAVHAYGWVYPADDAPGAGTLLLFLALILLPMGSLFADLTTADETRLATIRTRLFDASLQAAFLRTAAIALLALVGPLLGQQHHMH